MDGEALATLALNKLRGVFNCIAIIVDNVRRQRRRQHDVQVGYDVLRGVYVNMVTQGIIDPVRVTRSAVESAASIGAMILTTETLITDIPEKEKTQTPPMPEY